mmetsp:Transcript_17029/g.20791  ORF Transcript_17029/g.20791 Transcript_17029/m.20791 type:complete len:157 (-) Transcript_17029:345-815(-)
MFKYKLISGFLLFLMSTPHTQSFAAHEASQSSSSSLPKSNDQQQQQPKEDLLQLRPSDPNKDGDVLTLKFGETLKLDHLGPIILNTDGTTRRIANWDTLTEGEREVSWRRIKKRNEERRKVLEEQAKAQAQTQQDNNNVNKEKESQDKNGENDKEL